MHIDYTQLPHTGIRTLTPYKPGKPIVEVAREFGLTDIIKLASNENPLGCSPKALDALQTIPKELFSVYPSAINHPIYERLAAKLGIKTDQLILTNGSDYIFLLLFMGYALHTNKEILTHEYAFSTYTIQAQGLGIPVVSVPIQSDWQVDIDALIQACNEKTGLICLANPNNPTGLLIKPENIKKLLDNIPRTTLLVLDEAYYEFAQATYNFNSLDWLKDYPNLVITRTFSKAYGLAGLRLGYAIAHPEIINILHRLQLPFAVNQSAMAAGLAALDDDNFLDKTLSSNQAGKAQMMEGLTKLHIKYLPSEGNFFTIQCQEDGLKTYEFLLKKGIIVRPLHAYNMANYLRITIGTSEQNQRVLDALMQYLEASGVNDE